MRRILVFGSNTEGRHGKGVAYKARVSWGAIYGVAEGMQGDSYGIITKELRSDRPKITLEDIKKGVNSFLKFAKANPDLFFIVTPIGCGLAGFIPKQIAPFFVDTPENVQLPLCFIKAKNT